MNYTQTVASQGNNSSSNNQYMTNTTSTYIIPHSQSAIQGYLPQRSNVNYSSVNQHNASSVRANRAAAIIDNPEIAISNYPQTQFILHNIPNHQQCPQYLTVNNPMSTNLYSPYIQQYPQYIVNSNNHNNYHQNNREYYHQRHHNKHRYNKYHRHNDHRYRRNNKFDRNYNKHKREWYNYHRNKNNTKFKWNGSNNNNNNNNKWNRNHWNDNNKQNGYPSKNLGYYSDHEHGRAKRDCDRGNKVIAFSKTNIYINGIPRHWNYAQVEDYFGKYGKILSVNLWRDHSTGYSRGSGFVDFADAISAKKCIKAMKGMHFDGCKPLIIKYADIRDGNYHQTQTKSQSHLHSESNSQSQSGSRKMSPKRYRSRSDSKYTTNRGRSRSRSRSHSRSRSRDRGKQTRYNNDKYHDNKENNNPDFIDYGDIEYIPDHQEITETNVGDLNDKKKEKITEIKIDNEHNDKVKEDVEEENDNKEEEQTQDNDNEDVNDESLIKNQQTTIITSDF